jgi:hypothetical protein
LKQQQLSLKLNFEAERLQNEKRDCTASKNAFSQTPATITISEVASTTTTTTTIATVTISGTRATLTVTMTAAVTATTMQQ